MAPRSLLPVICLIGFSTAWIEERPVLETRDGNLVILSAKDRNITLRAVGKSSVNINDINLIEVTLNAQEAARIVQKWENGYLRMLTSDLNRIIKDVEGPNGLQRRLSNLEFGGDSTVNTSSVRPGRLGPQPITDNQVLRLSLRQLSGKVRILERNVRTIRTKLRTNECSSDPCNNGGTCIRVFDGFQCICPVNWEGPNCNDDVNECANFAGTDLGCQNGATCVNLPGSYRCMCAAGWHGIHCTLKSNACDAQDSRELCGHGTCLAKPGTVLGYTCICEQGWESEGTDPACTKDVDECNGKHPACSINPLVTCINLPGSYHCGMCPRGYTGNGHYCTDIDECAFDNGGCSTIPRVQCINTIGSSNCGPCPAGYQGNGISCTYVGLCRINNGGCHPLASCVEGNNLYPQCTCPAGYQGNGIGPQGCSPGVDTLSPCANNLCVHGECEANGALYVCRCRLGWTGTHCDIRANPCAPNPCQNNGVCRSTDMVTITCECKPPYTGHRCEKMRQQCGGMFRNPSGTLEYPLSGQLYARGLNCAFAIETNASMVLNITFTRFDMEKSENCVFDFLQIHDGENTAAHLLGRFCGDKFPMNGNFLTTYNMIYLWLKTDGSVNHEGFSFHWESVPPTCGDRLTTDHGIIKSPGSPGKYPNNKDCIWDIDVQPGKRILFHFFTLMIEEHPTCEHDYLEINETSDSRNTQLGLYCNHTHPRPITTSGSFARLHFHSDSAGNDMGFQITYSTVEGYPGCGGVYTADQGMISSPGFPSSYPARRVCDYRIQLPRNERIRLTWMSFEIERGRACRFDSVKVYSGPSITSPIVGTYCGEDLPPSVQIDTNEALIVFKSDFSNELKGFQLKYETICGGQFYESSGQIKSPYYPSNYPASRTCIYEIIQPSNKGIVLTVVDLLMESGGEVCYFDNLSIYDGDNENSTRLAELCGTEVPDQSFYSTHNVMYVKFVTDSSRHNRGFLANYTTVDRRCGGLMKTPTGVIQTPTDGESYDYNDDCQWTIKAPSGHVVQLSFTTFSLEGGSNCNNDYVLAYDGSADSGNEMGRFCGNTKPQPLQTQGESMTLVFRSDSSINHEGFTAHYIFIDASKVCGGHYYTSTGVLTSPNYPDHYPADRDCVWVITAPNKQQINLEVEQFELEKVSHCGFDYLEVRNGGYATSPLIDKYCGTKIPHNIKSLTNELYLRFVSDSSRHLGGFSIKWDSSTFGCGGTLSGSRGEIISPNYPQTYSRLAICDWKIVAAAGSRVQLVMVDFDIEDHTRCRYDYIEITPGNEDHHGNGKRYCGTDVPAYIDIETNVVNIRFRSDYTNSGRGFHLRYETLCVNEIRGFDGVIESPNFPNNYPPNMNCSWKIDAPIGNKINLTFSHFELEEMSATNSCSLDYLTIREGEENSANTEIGTFCGHDNLPGRIASTQNQVYLQFVTDRWLNYKGFRVEWYIVGCGGHLKRPSGEFTSPNYPHAYPDNIDCEWLIEVDHGSSVEITFPDVNTEKVGGCNYDKVILYAGSDANAPKLAEFCHADRPIKYTSTTNKLFVKFHADFSFAGRGFKATYKSVDITCGGNFRADQGIIHSANYPLNYPNNQNCEWLVQVDKSHVVNLTFTDFDIEDTTNCTDDYVKIFDGASKNDTLLGTFCKSDLPQPIVSSGDTMLVVMRSDSLITSKGFHAHFTKACGARLITEDSGTLQTSSLLHISDEPINCTWIVIAKDPADHVTFNFVHLNADGLSWDPECENNYVRIYEGDSTEGPVLGTWCSNKVPPPITSSGRALTIHLYALYGGANSRFGATYSVLNTACGGEYLSASGSIASPLYPDSYPINAECVWLLKTSPGNRISLTFSMFGLETSPNCDRDYVEIREDSGIGKLVGTYCSDTPGEIVSSSKLWIKFHSDESGTGQGFLAEYNFLHGNELTGVSGEIASPLYPHPWTNDEPVTWRITVDFGMAIRLEFDDVHIENFGDFCMSKVTIYDGFNDEAAEIASICGLSPPESPITSSSNVMYIKFLGDYYREGDWFHLRWYQTPRQTNKQSTVEKISDCVFEYDMTSRENRSMSFSSPGYPDGYGENLNCMWILTSPPGYHLNIRFNAIDLEESFGCVSDYITVYNGNGLSSSDENLQVLNKLCYSNETSVVSIGKSEITVKFQTDYYINKTGFRAIAWRDCGGELTGSNGVIDLNDTIAMYDSRLWSVKCEWNITVKPGRTIEVRFENFMAHAEGETGCKDNYVLLKNGAGIDSPFLGTGKYCDRNKPPASLETIGNKLYIKATGEKWLINFKIIWREVSMACGGSFVINENSPPFEFTSPNYPNIPPPFSECFWTFMAPGGERMSLHFTERFDLTTSINCTFEYVEIRDGGTEHSKFMGRFCGGTAPSSMTTTGNMMYVHFYTEVSDPKNGFNAAITTGELCGGILRGRKGVIKSPNYPSMYPINLSCGWWIAGPSEHTLKIEFRDIHLPNLRRCELTDYVSISGKMSSNNTTIAENAFGSVRWCGTNKPEPVETLSNEAIVMFHSDNRTNGNFRGFSLAYTASRDICGGSLTGMSGEFKTVGFPNPATASRYCEWSITVAEGSQVVVDILDMDSIKVNDANNKVTNIMFYNDKRFTSKIKVDGDPMHPRQAMSTSNFMMIAYYYYAGHRGLKARFRADAPAPCGGIIEDVSGHLLPPLPPYNESSFYCNWKLRAPDSMMDPENRTGTTLTVTISGTIGSYPYSTRDCRYRTKYIRANDGDHNFVSICGNITGEPYVARTPSPVNTVEIMNGSTLGITNFDLSYEWMACGGILKGPSHTISTPQNLVYPKSCVWHVKFEDPGSVISLTFNRINMGPCDKGFISVRNGGPLSPHIGNFCGNIIPHNITSSRNELWIEYWATQAPGDFEFQLNLVSGSCGGVFRGASKELTSPGFPKKYPNNAECTWEIVGTPSHKIGLVFVDRFNLETSDSCANDFLQIFDWIYDTKGHGNWVGGTKYCGRNTPSIFNATSNRLKVLFRTNNAVQGDGFRAMWEENCGGVFETTGAIQYIESPNYPHLYPNNSMCNYTIIGPAGKEIQLEFEVFELEGPIGNCKYDNMTINYKEHFYTVRDAVWCGDRVPPNISSREKITILFKSDGFVRRQGFRLKYFLNDCGGEITEPTQIKTPISAANKYFSGLNCTWVIRAPEGKSVTLRFETFELEESHRCAFDEVRVVEGDTLAGGENIAKLCGVLPQKFSVPSKGNLMTVMFRSDSSNEFRGMSASVLFSKSPASGCGGNINLTNTQSFKTQKGDKYDSLEDCHWTITTGVGENVRLTINSMDLKNATNSSRGNEDGSCSGDYLEVRDGGPHDELIGQYCGNVIPQVIISTMNLLSIRLFTDSNLEGEGVLGILEPIDSACGKVQWDIDSVQTFKSPNWPNDFPAGIHCRWLFKGMGQMMGLRVHFEEMNMEDTGKCEGDHLEISDQYHEYVSQGFGEDFIFNGRKGRQRRYGMRRWNSEATYKYCGQADSFDYYSSNRAIRVSLKSNAENLPKPRKFKFDVSPATCDRNFTSEQGRIVHERISECWTTITTAANRTISLYFYAFHFYGSDCDNRYVQIHDGDFNAPVIQKICGYAVPNPFFSTGNKISIHAKSNTDMMYDGYDVIYTTTDRGRGCGGKIYNYNGVFTSPMYPNNYRNESICDWEISVPRDYQVVLNFDFFDIGSADTCETDYIQVQEELVSGGRSEMYCPGTTPAPFRASENVVKVSYVSSVNNGGTGWRISFASVKGTDVLDPDQPYRHPHRPYVVFE